MEVPREAPAPVRPFMAAHCHLRDSVVTVLMSPQTWRPGRKAMCRVHFVSSKTPANFSQAGLPHRRAAKPSIHAQGDTHTKKQLLHSCRASSRGG